MQYVRRTVVSITVKTISYSGTSMKLFFLLIPSIILFGNTCFAAKLQVIHNASFDAAQVVDIYINGSKTAETDDLNYRDATPYLDVINGQSAIIKVAEPSSTGPDDKVLAEFTTQSIDAGRDYVAILTGVINPPGEMFTTFFGYDIDLKSYDVEGAADKTQSQEYLVNIFHGITDAPSINLTAYDEESNSIPLATGLSYGKSTGFKGLSEGIYELRVTSPLLPGQTLLTYNIKADSDNFGQSDIFFASGFLNPGSQPVANSSDYEFALFAASADGTVVELPVEQTLEYAYIQVIHNSPDPAVETVDIYINDILLDQFDDLSFRNATAFIPIPVGQENIIKVTPSDATDSEDGKLFEITAPSLDVDTYHIAMAQGVVGTGFQEHEMGRDISFKIAFYETLAQPVTNTNSGLVVGHGATDAPNVDIYTDIGGSALISGLEYGMATEFLEVPADDINLTLTSAGNNQEIIGTYSIPLNSYTGMSSFVFASGFVSVEDEADGTIDPSLRGFGLFVANSDGVIAELEKVEEPEIAYVQIIHNSPDQAIGTIDIYIDGEPYSELDDFSFRQATSYIPVPIDNPIVTVAESTSTGPDDKVINQFPFEVTLEEGMEYIAMISGVNQLSSYELPNGRLRATRTELSEGRINAKTDGYFDFRVFHGSTDAPLIDVKYNNGDIEGEIRDIDYWFDSGWLSVKNNGLATLELISAEPLFDYDLFILPNDSPEITSGVVFLSGFATTENEPSDAIGKEIVPMIAFPNGATEPLEGLEISVKEIEDIADLFPNPAVDQININMSELAMGGNIFIYDIKGRLVISRNNLSNENQIDIESLPSGNYTIKYSIDKVIYGGKFIKK